MKKFVIWLTLLSFLNLTWTSCRQDIRVHKDQGLKQNDRIVSAVLPDGTEYVFDLRGGKYIVDSAITGSTVDGAPVFIEDLISVNKLEVRINAADGTWQGETRVLSVAALRNYPEYVIHQCFLTDAPQIQFDQRGGKLETDVRFIAGQVVNPNVYKKIPVDSVLYVNVQRIDAATGCLAAAGVLTLAIAGVFVIAILTKESCPFVYAYDGEQYVFDAEPLGGAISRVLSRTEYSRFDHLQPDHGQYKVLFRNEVEEIQYLDEVKLAVIDHAPGAEFYSDFSGQFHTVKKPHLPLSATEEHGRDLLPFLKAVDGVYWQTHFPEVDPLKPETHRHQLEVTFPKPQDAQTAKLIVNAGTGLWGSNMIREMLQLRGEKVNDWYAAINTGKKELPEMMAFVEREELFYLKVNVQKENTWQPIAAITASGPLITETRVAPLDLRGIDGDSLTIRLNPPAGYWTIDYLAIEYENYQPPTISELAPFQADGDSASEILQNLASIDKQYQVMPEVGDQFYLSFRVPEKPAGLQRSLFLKTSGYYQIVTDQSRPEQTALIKKMMEQPGAIVAYSLQEYEIWKTRQLSKVR